MSIHPKTLSNLQKAGQQVFTACESFKTDLQAIAAALVDKVAAEPSSQDSDSAYQRLKLISALTKELHEVDMTLRGIYGRASSLLDAEVKPALALPRPKGRQKADVQDVAVRALPASSGPVRRSRNVTAGSAKTPVKPKVPGQKRIPNSTLLYAYLSKACEGVDGISLKHTDLAEGSGIPLGSVGAAVKALIDKGLILEVAASTYALPKPDPVQAIVDGPVERSQPSA